MIKVKDCSAQGLWNQNSGVVCFKQRNMELRAGEAEWKDEGENDISRQ
jgi:hypothetical protein